MVAEELAPMHPYVECIALSWTVSLAKELREDAMVLLSDLAVVIVRSIFPIRG